MEGGMREIADQIGRLREQLDLLERALGAGSAEDRLAWLRLDPDGRVMSVSPAAALRLELDADRAGGVPLGALADVAGDPTRDALLRVTVGGEATIALRVPEDDGGALVVLGSAAPAESAAAADEGRRRLIHDLANILGVMRGHAELLSLDAKDGHQRDSLQEIVSAADRGQALLEAARGD
jgi:hypothetical protein